MIIDFNGTLGTELGAYNANLLKNQNYPGSATITSSGRAVVGSVSAMYYYSETKVSADYDVSADFYYPDTTTTQVSVCGRASSIDNTMYHARVSGGSISLYKLVGGAQTQLGSSVSVSVSAGSTHEIKLSMTGTSIKAFFDGVEKISVTDTSISVAGYAGIRFNASQTTQVDNFNTDAGAAGASATFAITATLANITSSVSSVSAPKTAISATLANVTSSLASGSGSLFTTITATLGNITGAITCTGSTANGTFTSEVLKDYAGNVLANTALNFVRFYNDTTGALVLNKTGVSTNGAGIVTFSDAALVAGTTYRVDWETAAGSRRMPRKAAA